MRELTDGATAIVRGALDAGCDFFAGYPITPASPILQMLMRELPKKGGVAIQVEDEIASLGMCIGAAVGGSRVLTATSGPGLSLCSENLGLAVMGEVPLVLVDVQRMGPATGGATTVGQGDVQFARWGTSGGYPLIVLAPSSIAECYTLTLRAFDLSERFRAPVILLTDKELNLTLGTVDLDEYEKIEVRERPRAQVAKGVSFDVAGEVSPLPLFGGPQMVRFTGSTHDEQGYITKEPAKVDRLNRHLVAKIEDHLDELELVRADLQDGARTLVVSYGITASAMREGVDLARARGILVSSLTVQSLWPVPERAIAEASAGMRRVIVAELNLGQYRREIARLAPHCVVEGLHRIDGELIAPEQLVGMLA